MTTPKQRRARKLFEHGYSLKFIAKRMEVSLRRAKALVHGR